MKKTEKELNIKLNKILLNLSKKSSKLLDKTTDEQLKETIMSNCNNLFQLMTDFENVIKLSEEAYIDFSKKGEDIDA